MKVDFIDDKHFIIYYLSDEILRTEDEIKIFFKLLNYDLKHQYKYEFCGFYDVNIYVVKGLYVIEFYNIDDYGRVDFDITMLLNSVLLYEFDDDDIVTCDKIYYNGKFYVELDEMLDDIHLFEYGNIIFGEQVENILNNGTLIKN